MYAELNENDELVDGKPVNIYRKLTAFSDASGVQHPREWWQRTSPDEKAAVHIYPMARPPVNTDPQQKETGEFTYSFDGATVLETPILAPVSLNQYKNEKVRSITQSRNSDLSAPVFLTFGPTEYAFESVDPAKELLATILVANNSGITLPANFTWSSIDWFDENGVQTHEQTVVSTVTLAQLTQIFEAIGVRNYQIWKKFVELREQVDQATTLAEVDAVAW